MVSSLEHDITSPIEAMQSINFKTFFLIFLLVSLFRTPLSIIKRSVVPYATSLIGGRENYL
jgi:hypothetical protein